MEENWGVFLGRGGCTVCPCHAEECCCLSCGSSFLPFLLSSLLLSLLPASALVGWSCILLSLALLLHTHHCVTKFTDPHWGTPMSVISQACVCV